MSSAWFTFSVVACITLCTGFVLALALLRAAWARKEREALTSSDLRALEESAVLLIEQLKSEIEQGIEQIDARRLELHKLIRAAEERISKLSDLTLSSGCACGADLSEADSDSRNQDCDPRHEKALELAANGMDHAEIARVTGMGCAEVRLLLRMAKIGFKLTSSCNDRLH
jgi:hypothetical protein